jgi:hypothetical protein
MIKSWQAMLRERPASQMIAAEALSALLYAALTLPYSTPGHQTLPDWMQLFGLVMLLVLYGNTLFAWRQVMISGLRPAPMTRQRIQDDRRLRSAVLTYPLPIAVFLPIPSTWTVFWFWLTVVSTVGGVISLARLVVVYIRTIPGTGAHAGTPASTAIAARRTRAGRR